MNESYLGKRKLLNSKKHSDKICKVLRRNLKKKTNWNVGNSEEDSGKSWSPTYVDPDKIPELVICYIAIGSDIWGFDYQSTSW